MFGATHMCPPAKVFPLETPLFVRQMELDRFMAWRGSVEAFVRAQGLSASLAHVTESEWRARFAANDDAVSAVLEVSAKVDS